MQEPDTHRGIIPWFARNPVAANLLMISILVMGAISAITIKKEFFPVIPLNLVRIEVPYNGAAPQEVEEGVCIKIEEAIQDLDGLKEIRSFSWEAFGRVEVEIDQDYEVADLLDKIKMRVDAISTFPAETEKPIIYDVTTKDEVIWVQVYGDLPPRDMKEFAQGIRDELMALPQITQTELIGARDYEITIEVSEESLRRYNLTFDEIVQAVRSRSIDLPGGSIKSAGGEIVLRTKGQAYTGEEYAQIVIRTEADGSRLMLGDVATVIDGFNPDSDFFFYFDGKPSLGVRVYSVGSESALDVAKATREYVKERHKDLPSGISLAYWGDLSRLLNDRLSLMMKNLLFGAFLVLLSLTLFLRLGLALWVMIGLPVCFLGTLWVMPMADVSINMITLFGFILVLGIVVDDAIVIGENVFTTVQRDGPGIDNVIKGAREVAMPATFGVLTTIAAFLPMLMMPGIDGKIWGSIGIIVIFCLVFSLIESKLILPAHLAHIQVRNRDRKTLNPFQRFQRLFSDGLEKFVHNIYKPNLNRALNYRYFTVFLFLSLLILSVGLVKVGVVRSVAFPQVPTDFVWATVNMVQGTPADYTKEQTLKVEKALHDLNEEIKEEQGYEVVKHAIVWSNSDTTGRMWVELTPSESREMDSVQVVNLWREKAGDIPGAQDLQFSGTTGGNGAAIDFQLESENFGQLEAASEELKQMMSAYEGVFDLKSSFNSAKKEIKLSIKPEAEALGLTLSDLARQVRQAFYGAEAQRIQRGKDEIRVMVRYPEEERTTLSNLENMRIRGRDGSEIPFSMVADMDLGTGYAAINRINRQRVVNVTANVDKAHYEPGKIIGEIKDNDIPAILAKYPDVNYRIEGEGRDQMEMLASLGKNYIFALLLIFALMAVPLKSYYKPMIIMTVIPFGAIGAIFGHLICGLPLSILSLCGIIALSGVVVNDSLVMVDFINKNLTRGKDSEEAVRSAGIVRFRAILLTSLTTFAGLMPIVFERSLQSQFLKPMAISLAFGIVFATVITLFLIPSIFLIIEDQKRFFARLRDRLLKKSGDKAQKQDKGRGDGQETDGGARKKPVPQLGEPQPEWASSLSAVKQNN